MFRCEVGVPHRHGQRRVAEKLLQLLERQPQDREGPRPHHSAVAAAAGGSGDRVVNRRAFVTGLGAVLAAPLSLLERRIEEDDHFQARL